MSIAALIALVTTVLAGFFLLSIWIIEYDRDYQRAVATRLPVPVISAHAVLAITGLVLWILYLIVDEDRVAWAAAGTLGVVAILGLIMAARWIHVYRAFAAPRTPLARLNSVPPERNFPLPVVIGHGVFAVTTLVLVLFTALGVGGG